MTTPRLASIALALVAAAAAGGWLWERQATERPSILLVTIDTLRADRVGVYGDPNARTPSLDALAARGIRFDAAYATAPLTLPSHVSILSGLLPVTHSVRTNDGYRVPDGITLVGRSLQEVGYRTAAFVGAMVLRRETGIDHGFQVFDDDMGALPERRADAVVQRAVAWLQSVDSAPTFVWVHLYDPHLPYDPPTRYASPARLYEGEIEYADAALGRLVEEAQMRAGRSGLAVIVTADHGEGLGEHGERSHGALLYDTTIRVPLIVRLPRDDRAGTVQARPVTTAGIAAAILRLAGRPANGLATSIMDAPEDEPVVAESLYLNQQLGWSPIYAIRHRGRKAIDAPVPELYEVHDDAGERHNLAAEQPGSVRELTDRLRRELVAAAHAAAAPMAAAADPKTAEALASLGYVSGGRIRAGVEPVAGTNPIERMPLWSEIEAGLERSLAGAQDEAERIFERVLAADANNVLAMKFLGAYAIERGDLARGIALNERVLAAGLHIEDARRNLMIAHERRGAELARAGSTRQAIVAYRRIIELDESNLDARERLGALLHRAGASAEAREAFEFVLARDPARRAPALSLAILQLEAGQVEDAVRRLEPLTSGWEGAGQAQAYLRAAQRRLASK